MTDSASNALPTLLRGRDVIVSVGSGGVGKTTTAAAVALSQALEGRRSLALTIDPAHRLADSLGMPDVGNVERRIDLSAAGGNGPDDDGDDSGGLWAMMLEAKRTFDAMVEKYAPSPEAARKIFDNPFYQHISGALGGSQEYMAIEKLSELHSEKRFNLIVLDTPPTAHALEFFTAPERMLEFLDQSVLQWFLKPYLTLSKFSVKTFKITSQAFLKLADKLTGAEVVRDVLDFFEGFEEMYEGFRQRAETVDRILRRDRTGFLLVATPSRMALEEAMVFHRKLKKMGMPLMAAIINRATLPPAGIEDLPENGEEAIASALAEIGRDDPTSRQVVRRMCENARSYKAVMKRERDEIARFREMAGDDMPVFTVPRFAEDIHDLPGLKRFADTLFTPRN